MNKICMLLEVCGHSCLTLSNWRPDHYTEKNKQAKISMNTHLAMASVLLTLCLQYLKTVNALSSNASNNMPLEKQLFHISWLPNTKLWYHGFVLQQQNILYINKWKMKNASITTLYNLTNMSVPVGALLWGILWCMLQ